MEALQCLGSKWEYKWPTVTVAMRVARCKVFFACTSCSQPRRSWFYSDPSGSYDLACGAQMKANSAALFPPWFGLFRHKQARPRINKIKSQLNCKQRWAKRNSCFIARKQCTAQTCFIQVDDRLSAAQPTPHIMTHTKTNSLHSHASDYSSNLSNGRSFPRKRLGLAEIILQHGQTST
jgi:hypothetical protein